MKRILVVDDDDNLREILSATLSQRGRAIDTARDGLEALTLLNQKQYDVVLSDLRMPGLDGPALYEALRAMRHTTTVPRVIFMTGNVGGGEYAAFLQRTTDPILEKPFNLDVVRHVVSVLLKEQ
jgi:CheY-like chemotaxis protein